MLTYHVCTKCICRLVALKKAEIEHAFKQAGLELLDCNAIKLNITKVTGGEVGVYTDTVRATPKAKQSQRHQCKQKLKKTIYIYRKQHVNSASLSTGEDRTVHVVGEH